MNELDTAYRTYLASIQCLDIVSDLLVKSRRGTTFHQTVFFNLPLEEAKRVVVQTRAQLDDMAIVSLVSVFEQMLFQHPRSSLRSKTVRQGVGGVTNALNHFKNRIDSRVYEDVERLCRYRDWVAHGKRWAQPAAADPINAHARLRTFLVQAGLERKQ